MSESEEELDPMEVAEAEALAHALDRGSGDEGLPQDALEAAALLRYSVDAGALPRDREDAILSEVLDVADKVKARAPEPSPRRWWAWALGLAGLGGLATVGALLLFLLWRTPETAPPTAHALPAPDASLLSLSLSRIESPERDAEHTEAMRGYRAEVYDAIERRYAQR